MSFHISKSLSIALIIKRPSGTAYDKFPAKTHLIMSLISCK